MLTLMLILQSVSLLHLAPKSVLRDTNCFLLLSSDKKFPLSLGGAAASLRAWPT
jgi:hypothetical protein